MHQAQETGAIIIVIGRVSLRQLARSGKREGVVSSIPDNFRSFGADGARADDSPPLVPRCCLFISRTSIEEFVETLIHQIVSWFMLRTQPEIEAFSYTGSMLVEMDEIMEKLMEKLRDTTNHVFDELKEQVESIAQRKSQSTEKPSTSANEEQSGHHIYIYIYIYISPACLGYSIILWPSHGSTDFSEGRQNPRHPSAARRFHQRLPSA